MQRAMGARSLLRRAGDFAAVWAATWLVLAAVWMLLVDYPGLPELVTGAVCATLAATASELVRSQRMAPVRPRAHWLLRAWRPLARAPLDVVVVLREILLQLVERKPRRGRLRAIRFEHGPDDPVNNARRALAEALGSFAPNTFVIGIDRDQILAHQLAPTDDAAKAIDSMELG